MNESALPDQSAREEALDTTRSILVQAPAGSGKTELLALRMLKLLAEVEEPEQVLAITFTRSAAALMLHRVLEKLGRAQRDAEEGRLLFEPTPEEEIARAALANADRRGWRILDQPHRLDIQTIDSLCLRIAHRMPLQARSAGMLQPTEDTRPLYRKAARRTLDRLGGEDAALNRALQALLLLRDSNLESCETLVQDMLASRDQWRHAFPLSGDVDWVAVRERMEAPFQREIDRVLSKAHRLLTEQPDLARELLELIRYAGQCETLKTELELLAEIMDLPATSAEFMPHWQCLCGLLTTQKGDFRKTVQHAHGFPPKDNGEKARMQQLISSLSEVTELLGALCEIRGLPVPRYSDEQWETLRHAFVALRQAIHELDATFAEEGAVDFVEIGLSASQAFSDGRGNGQQLRHLLIDEFQDTSRRQHELVAALLRGWAEVDGRTVFLVGDPMQSIYMFRQADVELFDQVRQRGFTLANGALTLKTLKLTTNFRSNAGVVNPLNCIFEKVFPHHRNDRAAAVDFLPGRAANPAEPRDAYTVHASFAHSRKGSKPEPAPGSGNTGSSLDSQHQQRQEALDIVKVIERHLSSIELARQRNEEFTVAVLVRARDHLTSIAAALREHRIRFRAVDLDPLGKRQEVLDLRSLTRALLHPMDRIAWLSVLRAPWCGLELRDLHTLLGTDERLPVSLTTLEQIGKRLDALHEDARMRVARVLAVIQAAHDNRYRQSSFASWIERTWHSLGGPGCVDPTGYENARAYFSMLEKVELDGIGATGEAMADKLSCLFAKPDPAVSERCGVQLMTIHKAKGLGFNVVILPGLHRIVKTDSAALIRYLERTTRDGTEVLAAPIDSKGEQASAINTWVRRQRSDREAEERKRLLYVACTRARDELHLFATATVTKDGVGCPSGSLLSTAWPALAENFAAKYATGAAPSDGNKGGEVIGFPSRASHQAPLSGSLVSLAAASEGTVLRRLPADWRPPELATNVTATVAVARSPQIPAEGRHHAAAQSSRILGTIVHMLFERCIRMLESGAAEEDLGPLLPRFLAHAATLARNQGLGPQQVDSTAKQAVEVLQAAIGDALGRWILRPHPHSQTETSWTGMLDGAPKALRIDRSFRAGATPLSENGETLWIIDYKTARESGNARHDFLQAEKERYAEQLERYGRLMRLAHGEQTELRLALYYPLLQELLWWRP